MTDWQITATTIFCEAVADEVTILVSPDWTVKCTGLLKYTSSRNASLELVKRSLRLRKSLDCKGIDCPSITGYVLKLQAEENRKSARAGEQK
ncbi:MAG: hypothetical protein Q8O43_06455 [Dehalococcoidia bacterium]|nr:hypothetical protein [Dehalococcoidia bacterium]